MENLDLRVAELAVKRGLLSSERAAGASAESRARGQPLTDILLEQSLVTPQQAEELLAAARAWTESTARAHEADAGAYEVTVQAGASLAAVPSAEPSLPDEVRAANANPKNDLGKHILIRRLGRGGMGEVWKAWEKALRRFVAIKFIFGDTEEDRHRVLREARVAAGLDHPNIIPVYEAGESERGPFIAMKYVEGETLDRANLALRQKLMAVRDAALGIDYANRQGVVHRDIKPQNIMVEREEGTPSSKRTATSRASVDTPAKIYVMDFGLAKHQAGEKSLSVSGAVVGTPQYMPPEQARGQSKEIDARSDVYSLGATLYQQVAGVPPFQGEEPLKVLERVVKDEPLPPRRFNPALPGDVQTIVLKCLEKEKARRYATATDLAEDIRRYLEGEPISARPASLVYRAQKYMMRHRALVAAEALLFAVIAYGLYAAFWPTFGYVTVTSTPPGAEVTLEEGGRARALGRTPVHHAKVATGVYRLVLRKARYEDAVDALDVRPDARAKLDKILPPETGTIDVEGNVEGISITIEALDRPEFSLRTLPLPTKGFALPTGRYRLTYEKEDHWSRASEIVVTKGKTSAARSTLNPRELWSAKLGGLVSSSPAIADLNGDGVPDGVVGSDDSKVYALSGRDGARLWEFTTGAVVRSSPALADLNGDGVPDGVVGSDDSKVYALSGKDGARLWEFKAGGKVTSSPALTDLNGDGVPDVVVGSDDSKVYALSGKDGAKLWEFKTGAFVRSSPALKDLNGDGVHDVVVGSSDSKVYALSGQSGAKLWEFKTGGGVVSSPALTDLNGDGVHDVVVGSDDLKVYALSGKNGANLWEFKTGAFVRSSPALTDLNGDGVPDVVVGSWDSKVYALSGKNGAKLWEFETGWWVDSSPALTDLNGDGVHDVVVGSWDSKVYALSGKDGAKLWEFKAGGRVNSSPTLTDLNGDGVPDVVVGSTDSKVYALSGKDGARTWEFKAGGDISSSPALTDFNGDGVSDVVVGSQDSKVYALSGKDGANLWEFKTGASVRSSPALADLDGDGVSDVVVGSWDSKVYALSGRSGAKLWEFKTGGIINSSPALTDLNGDGVPDGVVGSDDSKVYALSGKDGAQLWEFKTGAPVKSSPALTDLNGDGVPEVVVGSDDTKVYALSGRSGAKLWEFKTGGIINSSPALTDLNGDGVPEVVVGSSDSKVYALSGKDGAQLWEFKTGGSVTPSPALTDLNGDGVPEVVVGSSDSKVYALSGKDGAQLWEFKTGGSVTPSPALTDLNGDGVPEFAASTAIGVFVLSGANGELLQFISSARVTRVRQLPSGIAFGTTDWFVRVAALEPRKRLPSRTGFWANRVPPGILLALDAVCEADWKNPGGKFVPAACAELLKSERDRSARQFLMMASARRLASLDRLDEAVETLSRLRQEGGDSATMFGLMFACKGMPQDLVAALERDPEGTCELLQGRAVPASAASSLSGRSRVAAHFLGRDYDLALRECMSLELAGTDIEKLRSFLPKEARPYLERAKALMGDPHRAAALALLAMARASADEHAQAALLAAQAFLAAQDPSRVAEILKQTLQRSDVPENRRQEIRSLLERLRP